MKILHTPPVAQPFLETSIFNLCELATNLALLATVISQQTPTDVNRGTVKRRVKKTHQQPPVCW